jgi:UDP-GlcNAc3NAcA epimerase
MNIKLAHVEAGLRSFNREMPEEINRVVTDQLSDSLFCPSQVAADNLKTEGITRGVHIVGDVMVDSLAYALERAKKRSHILETIGLTEKGYLLATVHRAENTDDCNRLKNILAAFAQIDEVIVFPIHPRTSKALDSINNPQSGIKNLILLEPLGYLDMVCLEQAARMILTDSGGIQKEAYWLSVPCVTLRDETEWVETVGTRWNVLAGANPVKIVQAVQSFNPPAVHPQLYGDGQTAQRLIAALEAV